jgi:hypothetical protein
VILADSTEKARRREETRDMQQVREKQQVVEIFVYRIYYA